MNKTCLYIIMIIKYLLGDVCILFVFEQVLPEAYERRNLS
jgi:hypothetical protein